MAIVTILSLCFVRSPSNPHEPSSGGWYIKLALACKVVQDGTQSACALSRFLEGPSIIRTDAPHCMLTSWVFWSISADVIRGVRGPLRMHPRFLKANEEAGALCVDSVRGGRPPGALGGIQIQGTRTETSGVAEISSTCAPTTCRRSARDFNEHRLRRAVACSTVDCVSKLPSNTFSACVSHLNVSCAELLSSRGVVKHVDAT